MCSETVATSGRPILAYPAFITVPTKSSAGRPNSSQNALVRILSTSPLHTHLLPFTSPTSLVPSAMAEGRSYSLFDDIDQDKLVVDSSSSSASGEEEPMLCIALRRSWMDWSRSSYSTAPLVARVGSCSSAMPRGSIVRSLPSLVRRQGDHWRPTPPAP